MTDTVKSKIVAIIADQALLEVSDIGLDQTLDELGIDSLGVVEAIFSIEETFDVSVPFNANDPKQTDFDITSVKTVIAAVERLVAEQAA